MSETDLNSPNNSQKPTTWVKFEEESVKQKKELNETPELNESPAVLTTESVQINLDRNSGAEKSNVNPPKSQPVSSSNDSKTSSKQKTVIVNPNNISASVSLYKNNGNNSHSITVEGPPSLRNVELNPTIVRQGFVNGDIVVTLLPLNTRWPWITPAQFRPELVPEELMAQGLTLTVEEYVHAMELLVNDFRFTLYNICYKRVLVSWIMFAFLVLIGLLFSGVAGLVLFTLGVAWLLLNAAAIFLCMWVKMRLSRGLEKCLAKVNKQLMRHKLIMALDDRGRMSCHKVNLCFMFFEMGPCIAHIQNVIELEEQSGNGTGTAWEGRMDVAANDIIIQGSRTTRLSRKQSLAEQALLRYLQRWGKDFLRRRLDWTLDDESGNPASPRHLQPALCPCQYVEELIKNKQRKDPRVFCPCWSNWLTRKGID